MKLIMPSPPTGSRRHVLLAAASAGLACAAPFRLAHAQGYPSRPVRLVIGYPAGGAADILGRLLATHLGQTIGQPVVVDNRPGASGTIAAAQVARSEPDGYTLYLGSAAEFSLAPSAMGSRLAYDPEADFVPIRLLVRIPLILVVHPTLPVSHVRQLIELAKSKPGSLNYASFGNGTSPHIAAEVFKLQTGIQVEHIAYKGAAPAMADVLAGRVPIVFDTVASAYRHVKAGTLKALAVTSERRVPMAPEVATMAESGVPGFRIESWLGLFCAAKTPPAVLAALGNETSKFLDNPEMRARLEGMGFIVDGAATDASRVFIQQETVRMSRLISDAGVRFD